MKLTKKWDLRKLGQGVNDTSFALEREQLSKKVTRFVRKWEKKKTYMESEVDLSTALSEYAEITQLGDRELIYLFLSLSIKQGDKKIQAAQKKVEHFLVLEHSKINFFSIDLGAIKPAIQKKFLESTVLKEHQNFLRKSFNKGKHLLSPAEEKILSLKSGVSSENWASMLEEFLAASQKEVWVLDSETKNQKRKWLASRL